MIWDDWIGLPHQTGADPRQKKAACCLVMAKILHESESLKFPAIDGMIFAAKNSHWDLLLCTFLANVTKIVTPTKMSLVLIESWPHGIGIGTVLPTGKVLIPVHGRGVSEIPVRCFNRSPFFLINQ
jgi:hypothetical protein